MSSRWAGLAGLWLVVFCLRAGAATPGQEAAADPAMRSTAAGVYSDAQAKAGQEIFAVTCIGGCHNMADHRGLAFKQRWDGRLVWDLFNTILVKMPKDDPGSLSDDDAIQLVAYLLKLNGLPAGKDDLSTDPTALKKIKIELPATYEETHQW
ncbi:MAG TPA: cytochrome c [Vicinamibacterales bacterium]|nr:cytochrome c [Vicinamibacterales bacterium]